MELIEIERKKNCALKKLKYSVYWIYPKRKSVDENLLEVFLILKKPMYFAKKLCDNISWRRKSVRKTDANACIFS